MKYTTVLVVAITIPAGAAELPVPCIAGNCGPNGPSVWVSAGAASATVTADTLRVNQTTDQAILNWASFNVGPDGHVIFQQPTNTSVALNRIYQESPSSIFGRVDANGQIYLVNPNGFIFGSTAKVNAAGILASTLGMTDDVFKGGLLSPNTQATPGPALAGDGRINVMDANGQPVLGADGQPIKVQLQVREGAQITSTGRNGRVLLAGQEIQNAGTISSPDGQVIMAAGQKVYLQASTDPALRGLLVEVDAGGKAWNQITGQLQSARGNITMTGLAVNQEGRISASTTVSANGSIRLVAQDTITYSQPAGGGAGTVPVATHSGSLEIGSQSRMEVLPELDDKTTAVDDQKQLASSIELAGHQIHISGGSRIIAPGGNLTATAIGDPNSGGVGLVTYDAAARIHVDSGALIDLSGSDATLPMSRNLVSVELRANELKDYPDQRDGALRGKTVVVDARVGTPLGDISGAVAAIPKAIAERTSAGGKASFTSSGDIVVADNASIDISGGTINYLGGNIATSQLITASGQLVDIGQADPARTYVGVLSPTVTVKHDKWGVIESRDVNGLGHYESGYVQGRDAGVLQFAAPQMVLNGTFSGHTSNGPYQRDAASLPSGGRLIVGISDAQQSLVAGGGITNVQYLAPSVILSDTKPGIVVGDEASIPTGLPLTLSTDYLKNGGFTDTEIYSDSGVTLPKDTPLHLADGSSLKIRAPLIDIAGNITALGGNIDAATAFTQKAFTAPVQKYGVNVADGVTLDVRGNWTNDVLTPTGVRAEQPVFKDGGSIKLAADTLNADLSIGSDTQFLATGGAWMNSAGKLSGGRGGNIAFSAAGFESALTLGEGIKLDAFGVAGSAGGAFTLNAGRISVGNDNQWARAQAFTPRDMDSEGDGLVHVGSALFDQYGFSAISLKATGARRDAQDTDVLIVESGTTINARADSLQLDDRSDTRQGGGVIADFSQLISRPEIERTASKVTLQVDPSTLLQDQTATADMLGGLNVQTGSVLQGDAGASFAFGNRGGGILVDGSVIAHGGSISMLLQTAPDDRLDAGFLPDLRVELGSSALLDVSGKAVIAPNDLGLLRGNLLEGGSVSLIADRGSIVTQAGSMVDVSGAAAQLDIPTDGTGAQYSRQLLASNGGSVLIRAPESIGLAGTLRAGGGVGDKGVAAGGALSFGLTRAEGFSYGTRPHEEFPVGPRIIEVAANGATGTIPGVESGLLRVDQKLVDDSGFDSLTLTTDGQIRLDDGVRLETATRLELYTPELVVVGDGARVHLSSKYVSIGDPRPVASTATPTAGTGTLDVAAEFLELVGSTVLQGVDQATLTSQGDIRLRNSLTNQKAAGPGSFALAGDLTLAAQRIYPATGTTFDITASGGEHNRITLAQVGSSAGNPLSAGGKLRISADEIVQAGTLLAPFGTIELTAKDSLTLAAGSLTSVSGAGSLIPYGQTQNDGKQWVFGIDGTNLPAELTQLPDRQVTLNGPSVELASGAVVDVSGGGDLYAYEFVPGTGGSKDRLGTGVDAVPGLYAVMPSMRGQYAPFDPDYADPSLTTGDSVYLSGVAGLPDGFYPLLPARYALLPDAFLIRSVAGFADLQPGTRAALPNGTQVVSGYRTFANTPLPNARYSGYEVHPGSYGRALAEYRDSLASTFFGSDSAHPADSGRLTLLASSRLSALGQVKTAAAKDGIGATIDVSALNLELVAHSDGTATDGPVQIGADVLNSWNPSRLLLGGRHSADGKSISVEADTVSVDTGVDLTLPEILMTGRESVSVQHGARISTASGASGTPLVEPLGSSLVNLTGAGAESAAFLALSDLTSVIRDRTPSADDPVNNGGSGSAGAQVNLEAGSQLRSCGSLTVDAPGGGALLGDIQGAGASWALASEHIVFGDGANASAPATPGLTLNPTLVASLQQAASVRLESAGSIDFETPLSLGSTSTFATLTLVAQSLKNLSGDQNVTLAADRVSLLGLSDDAGTTPASGGQGSLTLQANTLEVSDRKIAAKDRNPDRTEAIPQPQGNTLFIEGFGATTLSASRDIIGRGVGGLAVGGDLSMTAARLSAGAASDNTFSASGNVSLASSTLPAGATLAPLALGGSLSFFGNSINDAANIVVASGNVRMQAATDLTLGANAIIDVAGRQVTAGGRDASSAGGLIQLSSGTALTAATGSVLDVSGAKVSNAGALVVNAGGAANLNSQLRGVAGTDARGGSFQLDAGSLSNFSDLNARLQTGGFTQKQSVHVASGDLRLAAGTHTKAHDVELITDGGTVSVAGEISAPSSDDRSSLRLYGSNGARLEAGGALRADGAKGFRPGIIEIGSSAGSVDLAAGSIISAESAAGDGELHIRAPATVNDIRVGSLPSDLSHIGSITLEAVLAPFIVSNAPTDADFDVMRAAAADYSVNVATQSRLNSGGKLPLVVQPGIEVRHDGDLTLGSLDLSTWRFGSDSTIPVALTVRATGTVTVDGTISDGIDTSGAAWDLLPGQSATIRIAAGANFSGADPSAVRFGAASDLKLADNAVIRTGTGDIALTAAHDVLFGVTSSVYTAGLPGAETVRLTGNGRMTFPNEGGQLSVHAGHDVVGSPIGQSVTVWQPRQGSATQPARWGTDLAQFKWNVGTLGGGDVDVFAGHDVIDLSAAAADSAMVSDDNSSLTRFGAGSLSINAGNDIASGMIYVANGTGTLDARGAVTTSKTWVTQQQDPLGLFLQMGDARIDVSGRKGVALEAAMNPSVLPPPTGGARLAYFFTYGDRSALNAESAGGDIVMAEDTGALRLAPFLGQAVAQAGTVSGKLVLPASLSLRALTGDIHYNANSAATLFPSSRGQLELFAGRDVAAAAGTLLKMSDGAASGIPTVFQPQGQQIAASAEILKTASGVRHLGDPEPARISAGRDIVNLSLQLPKSARLTADRDIIDATLIAQNVNADDLTLISAGRDFRYSVGLSNGEVRVGGPGRLDVIAGRQVDLGTSIGLSTVGRLENPNLKTTEGAALTVLAGLAAGVDVSNFITKVVLDSDENTTKLVSFVAGKTGEKDLTPEQAEQAFAALDFNSQRPFILDVFFNELVQSGRQALDEPTVGYARGYAAIDALFPKSRLTDTPNPYFGDLSLAFSRIYTLAGGDISLLAPGGKLNVGLANPAVGIGERPASQLGIVAQGSGSVRVFTDSDVLVNQSRLFTLLGGDIAVWSTRGNIDAGRGAKSAVSAPPPTIVVDASGNITLSFGGAVTGSGIRTIIVDPSVRPGDVDLIAPAGFVNAGDAGIGAAGNLHIAASRVIGLDNIQVGGTSAGVPPDVGNLGASLSGASSVASSSSNAASTSVDKDTVGKETAPLAQSALSWLDVFVEGFGEEVCKASDQECLNRNRKP